MARFALTIYPYSLGVIEKSMELGPTIFNRRKKAPLWWFNKSFDLRVSAGILWFVVKNKESERIVKELNLGDGFNVDVASLPIYRMLCGMSLELIFKAVTVAKGNEVKSTHNLVKLAELAEIQYSKDIEGVLDIYTGSIVWDGKYPVPKTEMEMIRHYELHREHLEINASGIVKNYNNLFEWSSFSDIWSKANKAFWDNCS